MSGEQIREGYTPRRFEGEEHPSEHIANTFDDERQQLFLLSIFYYLMAVLFCLGGCGLAALLATALRDRYPRELFSFGIYGAIFLTLAYSGAVAGALVAASGSLAVHQRHTFCFVMSIVLLFSGIVGIPLGAWTLIVLMRRSVKELFDRGSAVLHLADGRITPSHAAGDKRSLRILCYYYIAATVGLIFVGLWLTAVAIFGVCITFFGDLDPPPSAGGPDQSEMALRVCIVAACAGVVWILMACLIRVARSLRHPMRYSFCIVLAAIICILPPLGTALGVATLLVLTGESVKKLFDHGPETN